MLLYRFPRDNALTDEDVDQALQWFHVLFGQEVVVRRHGDEVNETRIQFEMAVDVPEGIVPVIVV